MDMSLFGVGGMTGSQTENAGSPTQWDITEDDMAELPDPDSADEAPEDERETGSRSGVNKGNSAHGCTGAHPGNLKPATQPIHEVKKRKATNDFAEIAQAEELSRQKDFELRKARISKKCAKEITKQADIAYKVLKLKDKAEQRRDRAERLRLFELHESRGMGGIGHPANPVMQDMSGTSSLDSFSFLPHASI